MYLKKIRLQNIKCFEDVTLEFPHTDGDYSGWNVILGENGLGKSTLAQSAAVGLLNPTLGFVALQRAGLTLVRAGTNGPTPTIHVEVRFDSLEVSQTEKPSDIQREITFGLDGADISVSSKPNWIDLEPTLSRGLAYGYGPFRRATGAGAPPIPIERFPEPLSRFATVFQTGSTLETGFNWLKQLHIAALDSRHSRHRTASESLKLAKRIVNRLLPSGLKLHEVTSETVYFQTETGVRLAPPSLSDGYSNFLSLVLDLISHFEVRLGSAWTKYISEPETGLQIKVPAIVLIDEADAHLHPSWQRELGERLRQVFPKIQFIVTTHSPFIAQEATDGGLFVLRRNEKGTVDVEPFPESVRGWTATQILTSPLFGLHSTRSVETEGLVQRNTELLGKPKLTAAEKRELNEIKTALETRLSAPGETYEEMNRQQDMAKYVDETLHRLQNGKK